MKIPKDCQDNSSLADCSLILRGKFCAHRYYGKFCCRACFIYSQKSQTALNISNVHENGQNNPTETSGHENNKNNSGT